MKKSQIFAPQIDKNRPGVKVCTEVGSFAPLRSQAYER
jgi:hypothetical protein